MKSLLVSIITFFLVAGSVSLKAQSNTGFGTRQTQGILKGILLGSTVGGVIGNQKNKSVEGILIGGTIGAMIGSQTGKNQDYRRQKEREAEALERYRFQQALERQRQINERARRVTYSPPQPVRSYSGDPYNDPEIVAARQRAEKAELEFQRFEEERRRRAEKERMLAEYQRREREATQRLFGNR
jgi:hypothetical protein